MARYSVAEAQAALPDLVAAAERGEAVEIARDDGPVLRLVPEAAETGRIDPDWFEANGFPLKLDKPLDESSDQLIRRMRDMD